MSLIELIALGLLAAFAVVAWRLWLRRRKRQAEERASVQGGGPKPTGPV